MTTQAFFGDEFPSRNDFSKIQVKLITSGIFQSDRVHMWTSHRHFATKRDQKLFVENQLKFLQTIQSVNGWNDESSKILRLTLRLKVCETQTSRLVRESLQMNQSVWDPNFRWPITQGDSAKTKMVQNLRRRLRPKTERDHTSQKF